MSPMYNPWTAAMDGRSYFVVERSISVGSMDDLECDPDCYLELEDDSEDDILDEVSKKIEL